MPDVPVEELCIACQSPIIEAAGDWHGQPFCDSCVAVLKKQEAVEKEQSPICTQCEQTIKPLSSVRVKNGTILCSECIVNMDTPTGQPDSQNIRLAAIQQNLSAIRADTHRVAAILTIWFILMTIIGTIIVAILLYTAIYGASIWLKIAV